MKHTTISHTHLHPFSHLFPLPPPLIGLPFCLLSRRQKEEEARLSCLSNRFFFFEVFFSLLCCCVNLWTFFPPFQIKARRRRRVSNEKERGEERKKTFRPSRFLFCVGNRIISCCSRLLNSLDLQRGTSTISFS